MEPYSSGPSITKAVSVRLGWLALWVCSSLLPALFLRKFLGFDQRISRTMGAAMENGGIFSLILDLILLVGLVLILRAVGGKLSEWNTHKIVLGTVCLLIYLVLWGLPLIYPPGSVYRNPLPAKPRLIAHRGASMLAPENTLASARKAETLAVDGLETDLRVSLDGVLFLMHDNSLERTTDVAAIFPERINDRPESFTLAELRQLNAGKWFAQTDPYRTIARGLVNQSEVQDINQERIPTLAEVLDLLKENNLVFIFDILSPPPGHPFSASFFEMCFSQIHQAGFDSRIWFLAKGAEKELIASSAPGMILAFGADYTNLPAAQALANEGYQILNVEYGFSLEQVPRYQRAGIKVNLYVVDEPWLFSQAWLAGVDSLTTNNGHTLAALNHPVFGLAYAKYLWIWSLAGLAGLGWALLSWLSR
jgi:glycerophosphoryl diester phosphodiesterase